MDERFNLFMETVDERFCSFVNEINTYLTGNGCKCDIKLQKRGYVVSYVLIFLMNFTKQHSYPEKQG